VAHTNILPTEATFRELEPYAVRYEYDPRKAT
jgi:hypothetical protein